MHYKCLRCGKQAVPFFKAIFATSRTHGVECMNCTTLHTRPIWTFVALALLVPIWVVWIKVVEPPFHVGMYGLQVVALWALVILVMSPLKLITPAAIANPQLD